jgi:hypothetical protein
MPSVPLAKITLIKSGVDRTCPVMASPIPSVTTTEEVHMIIPERLPNIIYRKMHLYL